jgi:hypothetical protein
MAIVGRRTSPNIGFTAGSLKIRSALLFFAPKYPRFRFAGWQSGLVRCKNAISPEPPSQLVFDSGSVVRGPFRYRLRVHNGILRKAMLYRSWRL